MYDTTRGRHIVIIGRGPYGLLLAARLSDKLGRNGDTSVTFVDQSITCRWKSPINLVRRESAARVVVNVHAEDAACAIKSETRPLHLRCGRIEDVDRMKKEISLGPVVDDHGRQIVASVNLAYDTLILESLHNLFEVLR